MPLPRDVDGIAAVGGLTADGDARLKLEDRPTGSGLGLSGMRERVESLGGKLEVGPTADGGWRLTARLPIHLLAVTTVP